jgi:hypothetical protein
MRIPKFLETSFAFYPLLQTLLVGFDLLNFIHSPGLITASRLTFSAFFLSPLLWILLRTAFGSVTEGAYWVGKHAEGGNLWLLYYNLQSFYTHFSAFERSLRLVPGLYSAWLRLWGSKIGRKVIWTAECQVVDRGHLEIGDRVFLGNRCYLSAHALKKKKNRYFLYVKKIKVGSDSMVSFAVNLGPGVEIGTRAHIDAGAGLYPNTRVGDGETYVEHERSANA